MQTTLFGHLATRFATHPENLATEALGYILRESSHAREALRDLLAQASVDVLGELTYRNQATGDDNAQPDIVGLDLQGQQRLVIEAKFWAGLTPHQPVTYVNRLPLDGGTLLVIAPGARDALLWGELVRRCQDAGLQGSQIELGKNQYRRYALDDGRNLLLLSWRMLLEFILGRVESVGDRKAQGDVIQLLGLCERMDSEAFLPLTSEELTSQVYRRVLQFGDIVDDVVRLLVGRGVADTQKLTSVATKGTYGRYLRFNGIGAYLACDISRWMTMACTPLWITFGQSFLGGCPQAVRDALAPLASASPPRLFTNEKGLPCLPLFVPLQQTRDVVISTVMAQLDDLAKLLSQVDLGAAAAELLNVSEAAEGGP
jgi:hypothetical protein